MGPSTCSGYVGEPIDNFFHPLPDKFYQVEISNNESWMATPMSLYYYLVGMFEFSWCDGREHSYAGTQKFLLQRHPAQIQ